MPTGTPVHVSVADFFKAAEVPLALELVAGKPGLRRRVREAAINRPGFALAGFFKYFADKRIQVLGFAEHAYLGSLEAGERRKRLSSFFGKKIPCVVVARHKKLFPEMTELAEEFNVPLFRSPLITKDFVNAATILMENLMAPRMKVQGTMVEMMGIGVLLDGKAGMGKSETALGLIRKGAALVADDITALRVDSAGNVIAAPVAVTRYHMEIRGVGIVHVPSLFGVASVREEKKLDIIAMLRPQDEMNELDRTGRLCPVRNVLGVDIPQITLGVAPGRDLANVIETAALDQKLRRLGHDAAKELDERLMRAMTGGTVGSD